MKALILSRLRLLLSRQKAPVAEVKPTFPAVEIDPGLSECCAVVRRLRGQRFLMTDAPSIPLIGCTMKKCECRYVRFTDRRRESRRDGDFGILNPLYTAADRRGKRRGRRAGDIAEDVGTLDEDLLG